MKILGLIVEYNPFHNGHLYHLQTSKRLTNPDVTIAVMSGHFTQRGEPACTAKWHRAQAAIINGVDLVVELPYAYANQSANLFAIGAVSLLQALATTHLVFGSESGCLKTLTKLAQQMDDDKFQIAVKAAIQTGLSMPKAYAQINPALTGANNTLGIQYLRAISNLGAQITPLTIKRHLSNYHDAQPIHDKIASATAIRNLLNQQLDYSTYVPQLIDDQYMPLQNWESHYKFLRHKLLTTAPTELVKIHDMVEGIEHRLIKSAMSSSSFATFLATVATKRYPNTRIQRLCANVLTGTLKQAIASWDLQAGAPYVRILGFNENGSAYLKAIKRKVAVPIYSTFSKTSHPMLAHELRVSAAYASVYEASYATAKIIKQEYMGLPFKQHTTTAKKPRI